MDVRIKGTITGIENGVTAKWEEGKVFTDRNGGQIPTDILLMLKNNDPLVEEIVPSEATTISRGVSDGQLKKLLNDIEQLNKEVSALSEQVRNLQSEKKDFVAEIKRLKSEAEELMDSLNKAKEIEKALQAKCDSFEATINVINTGGNVASYPTPEANIEEEGAFQCPYCDRKAKSNAGLAAHIRQAHPDKTEE